MSENGERPAQIAFGAERRGGLGNEGSDDDEIQILDDDDEQQVEMTTARRSAPKKKTVPGWIFAVGGGIILTAVLGGGWMAVSMMKNRADRDEALPVAARVAPQPVIQSADATPQVSLVAGQGGQGQPAPAATVSVTESAASPTTTISMSAAPLVQPGLVGTATSASAATAIPPPTQPQPQGLGVERGADQAKVAALETELVKMARKVEDATKRVEKLEAGLAAIRAQPQPGPKAVATGEAKPTVPAAKPPVPAKPAQVAPKPVPAKVAVKPVVKPAPKAVLEKAAADEPAAAPAAPPARVQGYSISSMIGTRAWLVKRNGDGTETEVSVAPGEKIEGKNVTSVDGAGRCVTLEGGQKICVGK